MKISYNIDMENGKIAAGCDINEAELKIVTDAQMEILRAVGTVIAEVTLQHASFRELCGLAWESLKARFTPGKNSDEHGVPDFLRDLAGVS